MNKFLDFYRIQSIRLQNWDYGWNASYFVTVCTANKECYFGKITDLKMILDSSGIIAENLWLEIPQHFPYITLDAFVVMPNHVHGIIIIHDKPFDAGNFDENNRSETKEVETRHALSLQSNQTNGYDNTLADRFREPKGKRRFQNQGQNSLSSIIGSFKSAVTRHLRQTGIEFSWQPRFYDSIISDKKTLNKIRWYIRNNPKNWGNDTLNR